jgi:hypothetical protein
LTSNTTEPTRDRSGFEELNRWINDRQSEAKITLLNPLSEAICIARRSARTSASSGDVKPVKATCQNLSRENLDKHPLRSKLLGRVKPVKATPATTTLPSPTSCDSTTSKIKRSDATKEYWIRDM